jgi:hypothetical protein
MTVCRKIRVVARREVVVDTSECSLEELARQRAQDRRREQAREDRGAVRVKQGEQHGSM